MTRNPLRDALVAALPHLSSGSAAQLIHYFVVAASEELRAGRRVDLAGLGSLQVVTTAPRKGRNPKMPEITVNIPAKKRVRFYPAAAFTLSLQ